MLTMDYHEQRGLLFGDGTTRGCPLPNKIGGEGAAIV